MILKMIERKRRQLIRLVNRYGYTADKTIECSQQLDHLLNLYTKLGYSSPAPLHDEQPSNSCPN